ncbi:T9SS type A sorting domain-containing protein [uncultured Flavobacterium sp.]|uniref:T9SS type A sorting domain-containing protein n=1 Tax=uncultured Flavobacterium sp. TaxID=165435 RepID=UPI0030EC223C
MQVLQLDEKGEIIWKENYDFSDRDVLSTIIKSNDDTYVIGGFIEKKSKSGQKNCNYMLFKINNKGEKLWDNELKSQANDILRKVIETRDGGYLLSGTRKKKGSSDFLVIKLKDKDKPPTEKINIEAFPNPAQSYTNVIINYEYSYGTATLYDLNGRMIKSEKIDGSRTIPIDLSGLPQGIYIIAIDTDVQKDGIKIMKN